MRECMNEVLDLINAKAKCIWITTYEEKEVIKDIKEVSTRLRVPMPVYSFSFTGGLDKLSLIKNEIAKSKAMNVDGMLKEIFNVTRNITSQSDDDFDYDDMEDEDTLKIEDKNNIFVFKDFHLLIDNPNVKRALRDIIEEKYVNYNTIIVVSPFVEIPLELEKAFHVIHYDTPDEAIINNILQAAMHTARGKQDFVQIDDDAAKDIVKACKGLTMEEIAHIFRLSMVKHKTISLEEVNNYKIELIKKSNMLEYKIPNTMLEDIGGNIGFKNWITEVIDAMSPEAQAFGCAKPKGYLALGVPGSAKTMLAEALACTMNLPFLKLDMSKILDSKVGSSEKNMAQAIRMIKSTAPCVLLIDEAEKTLSGVGSSNNSDAGTMSRAFGAILEFLAEDHGVFVIMTSNDISQLPPELTRAGRLDAIWYFGLPESDERKEIFNIHFNKFNKQVNDSLLSFSANHSEMFTGAEIKEAVKNIVRKAYSRSKKDGNTNITEEDIQKGCIEIIPVAKSSREKITLLEEFAKNRARFSNAIINEYGCNEKANKRLAQSLLSIK